MHFRALKYTAELRLHRRVKPDLVRAKQLYAQAEGLWRHNSRLPRNLVAEMLYNQAIVLLLLQEEPRIEVISRLLEGLWLDGNLAGHVLADLDLDPLDLNSLPGPDYSVVGALCGLDDMSGARIRGLAEGTADRRESFRGGISVRR